MRGRVDTSRLENRNPDQVERSQGPHASHCENDLGWFDMRNLGAVLEHDEPLPHPACDQVP
jgi:hypothetical protein